MQESTKEWEQGKTEGRKQTKKQARHNLKREKEGRMPCRDVLLDRIDRQQIVSLRIYVLCLPTCLFL